ncbi:hypothetical protein GCM10010363_60340 [Streptomyces omiyaensis]|uniref:hypothetical protein n=1 Tax=Streptomyces omiyaensis TaxID=68247 RepID=UPI0016769668|nr:hypothetical protein [Streptomyces omiyaensis]GGY71124.1 hypothetical protein GCM10010363_60340 [Streptomyces omiyaensis]
MKTIGGRQWANRDDLIAHTGYSRTTIADLWRDRETNGHPQPRLIHRVMHWDLEEWTGWFEQHRQQSAAPSSKPDPASRVDRSGDPDELLPPAAQARLLGVDPSRITQYGKKPPAGWPEPAYVEQLPTRTREYRTRRQLWEFADGNPAFGTAGGRPPGPAPTAKTPDPRIRQAARALQAAPHAGAGVVAADLAEKYGGSVHTWKRIITEARKTAG